MQNVSFSLNKGESLALLGRNGAGMTSTLRSIACATSPSCIQAKPCSTMSRCR
jgi:branched-chain amino acid transport system ATP-binding protein